MPDGDKPEPLRKPFPPLEIVYEGPVVVTEDRDAFLKGPVNLREMLDNVARPLLIRIVCDAVFGDEDRFPESFPYGADRAI